MSASDTLVVPKSWIYELEREVDDTFERLCSWERDHYSDAERRECGEFLNEIRLKLGMPTIDVEREIAP